MKNRESLIFSSANADFLNCSMSLSYHKRIHNSIKFCLISFCLILCNHHLPCPFPLLGTDRPRLAVADKRLWNIIRTEIQKHLLKKENHQLKLFHFTSSLLYSISSSANNSSPVAASKSMCAKFPFGEIPITSRSIL